MCHPYKNRLTNRLLQIAVSMTGMNRGGVEVTTGDLDGMIGAITECGRRKLNGQRVGGTPNSRVFREVAVIAPLMLGHLLAFFLGDCQVGFGVCFTANAKEIHGIDNGVLSDLTEGCRLGVGLGVGTKYVQGLDLGAKPDISSNTRSDETKG